jgi:hypothetical protein
MAAAKFTAKPQQKFLDQLRQGVRRGAAAEYLGFARRVIDTYIADNPDFAEAVEDAEKDADELIEEAMFQAASNGNVAAAKLWLERRSPDRWAPARGGFVTPPRPTTPEEPDGDQVEEGQAPQAGSLAALDAEDELARRRARR